MNQQYNVKQKHTGGVWLAASRVQTLDGMVLAVSPAPPPLQDWGRARLWHVRHAHLVRGRYRRCLAGCVRCTVPGWSGTGSVLLPLLYKTGAVLACGMSAMLTWSEVGTGGVRLAESRVQSLDGVVLAVSPAPPPLQDGGPARLWHVRHSHLVRGRYRR